MQKGSLFMHQRDEGALAVRNVGRKKYIGGCCLASNTFDEIIEPLARLGREQHGLGIAASETQSINAIKSIDFIEHRKCQTLTGTDFIEHAIDGLELALIVLIRSIHDLKDQIGAEHLR